MTLFVQCKIIMINYGLRKCRCWFVVGFWTKSIKIPVQILGKISSILAIKCSFMGGESVVSEQVFFLQIPIPILNSRVHVSILTDYFGDGWKCLGQTNIIVHKNDKRLYPPTSQKISVEYYAAAFCELKSPIYWRRNFLRVVE